MLCHLLCLAPPLAAALTAGPAHGAVAPRDNASDRPWSLNAGMGPMVNLESGLALGKLGLDFQFHFRRGDVGPALGAAWWLHFRGHVLGFNLGPMFLWDFRVYAKRKVKLYIAPTITTGYALTGFVPNGGSRSAFFLDFGGQFKALVNDRVGVFVRPVNFSLWADEGGATGFWTALFGVTAAF
jgi:hypothetical protein